MKTFKKSGVRGEVFEVNGKVAGAVPPLGQPDAIPFEIGFVWPETSNFPAWADMMVGDNIRVRINPDICQPPYFRLFDCVKLVGLEAAKVMALEQGVMYSATLQGQTFVFWPVVIGGLEIIMIDTEERVLDWNPQRANDGQHRHGSIVKWPKSR